MRDQAAKTGRCTCGHGSIHHDPWPVCDEPGCECQEFIDVKTTRVYGVVPTTQEAS